jgi:PhoH-like ATPase
MPDTTKKIFVLDTSVLLYSAASFRSFGSKEVVIPYVVLEELDRFKTRDDEVGRNARQVARELNVLRQEAQLSDGVSLNTVGGLLRVELNHAEPLAPLDVINNADDRILNVCLGLMSQGREVVLVSKDINLIVRADVLRIKAQDYETDKTVQEASDIYTGTLSIQVADQVISNFYSDVPVYLEDFYEGSLLPNQYMTLVSLSDPGKSALARYQRPGKPLCRLRSPKEVWGVKPRSREQQFVLDAMMNKDIPLVTFTGNAGTGKTLLALACCLQLVQEDQAYDRLIVSRPVQPMGKDIGYLPGTVMEKMDPWMGPIKDAINFLMRGKAKGHDVYMDMVDMGVLEVEPLTYLRGRSLPKTLFLIDEAQDLSRQEMKTIVSRMGEESKLILIGDVKQISNPYLDPTNSGLSNVIEKFKNYDISAHVTLVKGERSSLATIASEIL